MHSSLKLSGELYWVSFSSYSSSAPAHPNPKTFNSRFLSATPSPGLFICIALWTTSPPHWSILFAIPSSMPSSTYKMMHPGEKCCTNSASPACAAICISSPMHLKFKPASMRLMSVHIPPWGPKVLWPYNSCNMLRTRSRIV